MAYPEYVDLNNPRTIARLLALLRPGLRTDANDDVNGAVRVRDAGADVGIFSSLNFSGATVAADEDNDEADITIAAGAAGTAPFVMSPLHPDALGLAIANLRAAAALTLNVAWPAANLSLAYPFVTHAAVTLGRFWWLNGTAVAGNVDIGIYTAAGVEVASATSQPAQTGTSVMQFVASSGGSLAAGAYVMVLSLSSASGRIGELAGGVAEEFRALGCHEKTTNHPIAASYTPSAYTRTFVPFFGVEMSGVDT